MTWRQQPSIWKVDGLSPTERLVLLALAFFTNSRGSSAYPSQATLATMCNVSIPTIKRALRTLRKRQLIVSDGKGRKGTVRYNISLPLAHRGGSPANGGEGSPVIYNPGNRYPINKEKDSNYFDSGSGDSQPRYHRRTRQELVDEDERERAAMRARLDARNKR
jgi:DNA-binding transcriptional MocR family regulator